MTHCVKEFLLLDANPSHAHIRLPKRRESTVSTSDLAPYPETLNSESDTSVFNETEHGEDGERAIPLNENNADLHLPLEGCEISDAPLPDNEVTNENNELPLRRSTRVRRMPDFYGEYVTH